MKIAFHAPVERREGAIREILKDSKDSALLSAMMELYVLLKDTFKVETGENVCGFSVGWCLVSPLCDLDSCAESILVLIDEFL